MKDEVIADLLRRAVHEERASNPRFEALTRRALGDEEARALIADAESDPRLARALAAFEPLSAKKRGEITAKILEESRPTERGKLVRLGAAIALPLAVAAGVMLYVGRGRTSALPSYELAIGGSAQTVRASVPHEPNGKTHLHPGAPFELVARPETRVDAPIAARAALVHEGRATSWAAPIEISAGGSVRVAGDSGAIFPETRGTYEVVLVITHSGEPPSEQELSQIALGRDDGERRVLRGSVVFDE